MCNRYKGAKVFNSVDEARTYLQHRVREKGWSDTAPILPEEYVVAEATEVLESPE